MGGLNAKFYFKREFPIFFCIQMIAIVCCGGAQKIIYIELFAKSYIFIVSTGGQKIMIFEIARIKY